MKEQSGLGISKIGQIAIPAQDVARAEAFYRDVLGLKHLFTVPNLSFFDCGGTRLMLDANLIKEGAERHSPILYYLVADLKAAFARVEAARAKIIDPPHLIAKMPDHELWMGFFKDSEDNTVALMAEQR